MSNIYVKWQKLYSSSKKFDSCAKTLSQCADQVETTRSRLRLSDEVASSIRAKLKSDASTIHELTRMMERYADSLNILAGNYSRAEENNIAR